MNNFVLVITIGIIVLLAVIVCLIISACNKIKHGKAKVVLYFISPFIVLFTFILSLFMFSLFYNYNYVKGLKQVEENDYTKASKFLYRTLTIRHFVGSFDVVFDYEFYGIRLFFSKEPEIHMHLANMYKLSGNYTKAIEEYEEVNSFYKDNFNVIAAIAESYFLLNNFRKSEQCYKKLLKIKTNKNDASYFFQRGKAYMVLWDNDNAAMCFRKSIELGGDSKRINRLIEKCKDRTLSNSDIEHSG